MKQLTERCGATKEKITSRQQVTEEQKYYDQVGGD